MNPLHDNNPARQAARSWSRGLGSLATASSAVQPAGSVTQLDPAPPAPPARLASILVHLRQRSETQQHAADKLRANEFITGT